MHAAHVFGYADDLLLLCPSQDGLQKMLNIAEKYAHEGDIFKINLAKFKRTFKFHEMKCGR
jgi:hypothetical protein